MKKRIFSAIEYTLQQIFNSIIILSKVVIDKLGEKLNRIIKNLNSKLFEWCPVTIFFL